MKRFSTIAATLTLAAAFALPLVACQSESGAPSELDAPGELATSASNLEDGPIRVDASGNWSRVLACSGRCVSEFNFWVDLAVRNDAYHKQVGVLWTDDGWATMQTTWAVYENDLGDGWERWGIDVMLAQGFTRPEEVEYAVFVTMNGFTHWDPLNNYFIYKKVSAENPVRRLSSEVHYEAGVGAVMTGRVRVFDLAFEKRVTVVYSTDGWTTVQEAEAEWNDRQDWVFRVEGLGTDVLPADVTFAVRYIVDGVEYWDNNDGRDYRHVLQPRFDPEGGNYYLGPDRDRPVCGVVTASGNFSTDLPVEGMDVRLDGGDWTEARSLTFSTHGLAPGDHDVEFRLRLTGGYEAVDAITYSTADCLTPTGDWWPPQVDSEGQLLHDTARSSSAWDIAVDGAGRVYLLRDDVPYRRRTVVRYDAWGDELPSLVFGELPDNPRINHIAADADGRIYAVESWGNPGMYRFAADGTPDDTFGVDGHVDLNIPVDGMSVCNAGQLVVSADFVYVLDTCNDRVVRLTLDGDYSDVLPMPAGDSHYVSALHHDGEALWVLESDRMHRVVDLTAGGAADAPMTVDWTVELTDGYEFNGADGLTRDAEGRFWSADGTGRLVVFDDAGEVLADWWSYGPADDFLGGFHLPQNTVTLPDGDITLLAAQGARLPKFSAELP